MGLIAAGAIGSAVIGGVSSSIAAGQSAKGAAASVKLAQQQNFDTRKDLMPFHDVGINAADEINAQLPLYSTADSGYITQNDGYVQKASGYLPLQAGAVDQANALYGKAQGLYDTAAGIGTGPNGEANLAATPGYQFALQQGLRAAQNSASARGLGVSGAAMKGAATFATGLADQTYLDQYNVGVRNAQNIQGLGDKALGVAGGYASAGNTAIGLGQAGLNSNTAMQGNINNSQNRLLGVANLGENAAAQTGSIGATLTNQAGQGLIAQGNANAAGSLGIANALTGNIQSGANNYLTQQAINAYSARTAAQNPSSYASNPAP